MTAFAALVRKQFIESRWVLGLTAAALFGFGWLYVFVTSLTEAQIRKAAVGMGDVPRLRMLRSMGVTDLEPSTVSLVAAFWHSPAILLAISVWAVGRGSVAVAAEVERGTLDLILSRPVRRTAYLGSQVAFAVLGLLLLAAALVAGSLIGSRYNTLREPLSVWALSGPALNLAALGLAMYGYTLLFSSLDSARWRPNLLGAALTLGGFIAWVVALLPVMADSRARPWLERVSIFKAFNPVEIVTKGETLGFNLGILTLVGLAGIGAALLAFSVRDLPANS